MYRGKQKDMEIIEALMESYAQESIESNKKLKEMRKAGGIDTKEYLAYAVQSEKSGKMYDALYTRYMRTYFPEAPQARPLSKAEFALRVLEYFVRFLGIGVCVWQSFMLKQWEEDGGFFMRKNVIQAKMPDPYH